MKKIFHIYNKGKCIYCGIRQVQRPRDGGCQLEFKKEFLLNLLRIHFLDKNVIPTKKKWINNKKLPSEALIRRWFGGFRKYL